MSEREGTPEDFARMFGSAKGLPNDEEPVESEASEPATPELPPADKPFSEYTEADWDASHAAHEARARAREQREREGAEAPEKEYPSLEAALLDRGKPGQAALIALLHPEEES